jgi:hypothetical protein
LPSSPPPFSPSLTQPLKYAPHTEQSIIPSLHIASSSYPLAIPDNNTCSHSN